MHQLLLDVFTPPEPNLKNFVAGDNEELMSQLKAMIEGTLAEAVVFVFGQNGCGKTHLLRGLAQALSIPVLSGRDRLVWRDQYPVLIIDDVQLLTPYSQVQLFNALNESRMNGKPRYVLMAANAHPNQLTVREDLKSRMTWGLSYRVAPLSDEQKQTALMATAHARGLNLASEVVEFALTHCQRDMGSLSALLDGLDQFSLEQQKPVSLHLLRNWMRRREALVVKNPA